MCVNKIYIKNNKLDFNPAIDRFYNYVPCGQCDECLYQRSLQYENRAIAEFEDNQSKGGVSFYYTLTYNDKTVPKFKGVNVFSKSDIQDFHKRLRKYLSSHGYPTNFRYFLSSEYGHQTLRPHYHAVYFLPYYISPIDFKKAVKTSWQKGFIYAGTPDKDKFKGIPGLIADVRPFHYVAKYVQKDCFALVEFDKKGFTKSDFEDYKAHKKDIYKRVDLLPFHFQSLGFGASLLFNITAFDLIRGYYVKTNSLGISKRCPVPFYIQRKLMYDTYINSNGTPSYKLNSFGLSIFMKRATLVYYQLLDNFNNLLDFIGANYNNLSVPKQIFTSYAKFRSFALSFPDSPLSKRLATYSILYRSNFFVPFQFKDFNDDLLTYVDYKANYSDNSLVDIDECYDSYFSHLNVNFYDSLISMFEEANCLLKYRLHLERVRLYNIDQQYKSFTTKKLKLLLPKNFSQFKNLKTSFLCLNMLTSRSMSDVA